MLKTVKKLGNEEYSYATQKAQAMEFLLAAREQEDANLWFLDYAEFDGMRNDPRFVELIRGLNLPEEIYLSPVTPNNADKQAPGSDR